MIRYIYNNQKSPPAPFVYVLLANPDGTKRLEQIPAQLDTGADQTVVPLELAVQLELVPIREKRVGGLCGEISALTSFLAQLAIHEPPFRALGGGSWAKVGGEGPVFWGFVHHNHQDRPMSPGGIRGERGASRFAGP
jgi:hypothetical protein